MCPIFLAGLYIPLSLIRAVASLRCRRQRFLLPVSLAQSTSGRVATWRNIVVLKIRNFVPRGISPNAHQALTDHRTTRQRRKQTRATVITNPSHHNTNNTRTSTMKFSISMFMALLSLLASSVQAAEECEGGCAIEGEKERATWRIHFRRMSRPAMTTSQRGGQAGGWVCIVVPSD